MAFPLTPLGIRVELQLAGTWTDITEWVYGREGGGIDITRGYTGEGQRVEWSRCRMELDNRDGRFSARNPRGAYYGLIGLNTPIRVSADPGVPGGTALYLPGAAPGVTSGYVTTPDTAALDITGDLDVRIEARLDNWWNTGPIELAGKYGSVGQRSWRLVMDNERPQLAWLEDGVIEAEATATADLMLPPSNRIAVRATLDVDNGAGGHTVTFYYGDSISGEEWTQLGDAVTTAGTTSIFASTAALEIGGLSNYGGTGAHGRVHAFQLRAGIDGTLAADVDFSTVTSGASAFTDDAGLTWTVGGDAELSGRRTRFHGEVPEWPVRWDTGGFDVYAPIEAAGILRRLGQGAAPRPSPLFLSVSSADDLLGYWPLEDEQSTTLAYSPLPGVEPIRASMVDWATDESLPASGALPTLDSDSQFVARVPRGSGAGWHVEMVYERSVMPSTLTTMLDLRVRSSTLGRVLVRISQTTIRIETRDQDGAVLALFETTDADAVAAFSGQWNRLQVTAEADGADTQVTARWIRIDTGIAYSIFTIASGVDPGHVSRIVQGTATGIDGMSIGHIAAFDTTGVTAFAAADGYSGESSINRMVRLANEYNEVRVSIYDGDTTLLSELMGPQRPDTFLELMRECADADGGVLYERATVPGLTYRDRATLYNQDPALTVPYSSLVAPLDPVDDDQALVNDVTVKRQDGSSGRAEKDEGALSVHEFPDGAGRYRTSITRNLASDMQTKPHADWLVHLGTWDEARWPAVTLDLARTPELIEDATAVDVGDVARITGPPQWLPPDDINLLIRGYREFFSQHEWRLTYVSVPAGPYTVAEVAADDVADDGPVVRADTDSSVVSMSADAEDTTLLVRTTEGPEWVSTQGPVVTAEAGDLPFEARLGGEVVTVSAIEPFQWDDFNRTETDGWGTTPSAVVPTPEWIVAGGTAAERSVSGGTGLITCPDTTIRFMYLSPWTSGDIDIAMAVTIPALATGAPLYAALMSRIFGSDYYSVRIACTTTGAVNVEVTRTLVSLSGVVATGRTYTAGSTLWIRARTTGHRVQGRVWRDGEHEPASWQVDETVASGTIESGAIGLFAARGIGNTNVSPQFAFDDFRTVTTQLFTVTRSVNGIEKAQSFETDVRLAQPMIIPL